MSTTSKWLLYLLLIPALLLLAAALLLPVFLDKEKVLEMASSALEKQTGATLTVDGGVDISLFPTLGVALEEANLVLPGEAQPGMHARSLVIGVQLLPLFSKRVEIDTIGLDGLVIQARASEKEDKLETSGLTDEELEAFYQARRETMAERGAETAGSALTVPLALSVERLTITDARLETTGPGPDERSVIELEKLHALGLNLEGRPIPIELRLRIPGEAPVEVALDGSLKVEAAIDRVIADKLHVRVEGATARPLELQVRGELDISRQVANLVLDLALGDTRGNGTLRYASFESPQVDARLELNLFDPALLALAGPEAAGADAGEPGADGSRPLPLDAIRTIDTRAELAIERAVFGAHSLSDVRAGLRAVDGLVTLQPLKGNIYDGTIDLQATFDGRYNTARLSTTGGVKEVNIGSALVAMETGAILTGTARAEWNLTSEGRTVDGLVAGLSGPVNASVDNAVLQELGVEKMLCEAVALVNRERMRADLPDTSRFQELGMTITLGDGQARLKSLRAQLQHIGLTGSGRLDLLSQAFRSEFKARLSPTLGELDPACEVSKRLTSIDWTVDCEGQVQGDPGEWCAVDTEEIIEDLAKYEVQRKVEKKAGKFLEKLLD